MDNCKAQLEAIQSLETEINQRQTQLKNSPPASHKTILDLQILIEKLSKQLQALQLELCWMQTENDPRYELTQKIKQELAVSMGSGKTGKQTAGVWADVLDVRIRINKTVCSFQTLNQVLDYFSLMRPVGCLQKREETEKYYVVLFQNSCFS